PWGGQRELGHRGDLCGGVGALSGAIRLPRSTAPCQTNRQSQDRRQKKLRTLHRTPLLEQLRRTSTAETLPPIVGPVNKLSRSGAAGGNEGLSGRWRQIRHRVMLKRACRSLRHGRRFMSDDHGRFIWYELMTPDLEAAKRFYGAVVGWKAQAMPMGEPDHDHPD